MKERPIIFSGPMVRAILDGKKTQTRRVIKPQPMYDGARWVWIKDVEASCTGSLDQLMRVFCPYGFLGDRLYVKETWQNAADMNICHQADNYVVYRATDPDWETMENWKWRPSIFMPKSAARIWLEIIDIRVERVQDISLSDVLAEGTEVGAVPRYLPDGDVEPEQDEYATLENFIALWDSINAKRGYSWASNPYVWVIEFKRIKP